VSDMARLVPSGAGAAAAVRGAVAVFVLFALSGCLATTKRVDGVETDLLRQRAWADERIARIDQDIEALRAENEALSVRIEDLRQTFDEFGTEFTSQISNLDERSTEATAEVLRKAREAASEQDRQREIDREELLDRMNVILEEVVRENASLRERIDKLESSAFTFGQIHRVKEGESVASIARKYGVAPEAIVQANDLSDANLIHVGQELLIPGVSK
jgi:LysM repeat protein